jgi:hypothetical protein
MYRLTALCEDALTLIVRLSAVAVGLGAWRKGKTKNEIVRCLKRYIASEILHALHPPGRTAELVGHRPSLPGRTIHPRISQ